jgi:hypothetical protein
MDTHPVPRLSTGSPGFTFERLRSFFTDHLSKDERFGSSFGYDPKSGEEFYSKSQMQARLHALCHQLAEATLDSDQRLELLDAWLAWCTGWSEASPRIPPGGVSVDEVIKHTMQILHRLPACSTAPPDFMLRRKQAWYSGSRPFPLDSVGDWERAVVARYLDHNTIHIAISTAVQRYHIRPKPAEQFSTLQPHLRSYLNKLASIMDESNALWAENNHPQLADCYLELAAFVWTAWQRSLTLFLYDVVRERLIYGATGDTGAAPAMPFLAVYTARLPISVTNITPSVCLWALNLIRTNAFACGGDLRTIIRRCAEYCQELDMTSPRCVSLSSGDTRQCSGDTLEECNRFTGLHIENQSAHADSCHSRNACAQNRLRWDPLSYKSVQGGKAVSVASNTENGLLQYCPASDLTLTVSHVWSHGQGGRPDIAGSGMNSCLHERYRRLAIAHGCDSYWIDSACIPSDHNLRQQAISEINRTFSKGKVTLVCDKDIMMCDIADLTVSKQERILSMLLLCDWNLRAWTYLEAMRGRSHLHLLCKDEKTVSVKLLVETLSANGSLDLLALFADAHHLLPGMFNRDFDEIEGMVSTEEAACLLSRRHASREGDEVVIWSLLCGGPPHQSPEDFWRQHQAIDPVKRVSEIESYKKEVCTAFLVSTAPRISVPGLRWAPARPAPELQVHPDGLRHAAYPVIGMDSQWGRIIPDGDQGYVTGGGLESIWNMIVWETSPGVNRELTWWKFPFSTSNKVREDHALMSQIEKQYLRSYRYCALLRPVENTWVVPMQSKVLRRKTFGDGEQEMVVVVGCNEPEFRREISVWTWLAVIALPLLESEGRCNKIILQ